MDSDSDMEESYSMDSDIEQSYYSSCDEEAATESDEPKITLQKKKYSTLKEEDIKKLVDLDISETSNILSITRGPASALLHHYAWRVDSAHENWFTDEEKVRQTVGLYVEEKNAPIDDNTCKICFDEINDTDKMFSAACKKHMYCIECWTSYIIVSITDGAGCLTLRCPEPKCKGIVDSDMIDKLASDEDKVKYYKYLYRSYVEENLLRKWCPSPGCDSAIQLDGNCEEYDVTCANCRHLFCWNCCEEKHRPVDCETVEKWILKNTSESENAKWLLAYTKQCPKCKRAIEKNQGCNTMTCRKPCNAVFCWNCLQPSISHGNCNGYKAVTNDGSRTMTTMDLERYAHYYDRWDSNNKSLTIALNDLNNAKSVKSLKLAEIQGAHGLEVAFVQEAWEQIVECRRVLKWSYTYAYYMPQDEREKKGMFEYLQGEAESALERLHHCAEIDMGRYIEANGPMEDFKDYRTKLIDLTKITKSFFEKLLTRLENGFVEMDETLLKIEEAWNQNFEADMQKALYASLKDSKPF